MAADDTAKPYGNDLWNAFAAITGIHPDAIRRFDAALASSPQLTAKTRASQGDVRAAGYGRPGERDAGNAAQQFVPWNATAPANGASYASAVSPPGPGSVPIEEQRLNEAVTRTAAKLYNQNFRPYMAGRTFGVLDA
jgi:hypothetical protein